MSVRGAALWSMSGQYLVFIAQFVMNVIIARFFLSPRKWACSRSRCRPR
jgi:hypothetical protein